MFDKKYPVFKYIVWSNNPAFKEIVDQTIKYLSTFVKMFKYMSDQQIQCLSKLLIKQSVV